MLINPHITINLSGGCLRRRYIGVGGGGEMEEEGGEYEDADGIRHGDDLYNVRWPATDGC